jgi:hypothetical protein
MKPERTMLVIVHLKVLCLLQSFIPYPSLTLHTLTRDTHDPKPILLFASNVLQRGQSVLRATQCAANSWCVCARCFAESCKSQGRHMLTEARFKAVPYRALH